MENPKLNWTQGWNIMNIGTVNSPKSKFSQTDHALNVKGHLITFDSTPPSQLCFEPPQNHFNIRFVMLGNNLGFAPIHLLDFSYQDQAYEDHPKTKGQWYSTSRPISPKHFLKETNFRIVCKKLFLDIYVLLYIDVIIVTLTITATEGL